MTMPPMAEPRAKIPDQQFREYFSLIMTAMGHELAGSLSVFSIAPRQGEMTRAYNELLDTFSRIHGLRDLCRDRIMQGTDLRRFSEPERAALGIGIGGKAPKPDIDEIRRIGKDDVMKFRELLLEAKRRYNPEVASATSGYVSRADWCVECGQMLCGILEKLMDGDLDFKPTVITQRINDVSDGQAVSAYWQRAASDNGCAVTNKFTEEDGRAGVRMDPIFCALIFHNIFSNARRAMDTAVNNANVAVSIYDKGDAIELRFSDRGCGMTRSVMRKLNSGVPISTKEPSGEHGIGFGCCRELAEKMGGKLFIGRSTVNEGTVVVLELERAR